MLGDFEQTHPKLDLQLIPTTRVVYLRRDHVDLAVRHGKGRWPGVEALFLFEDLVTPVCAPTRLAPIPADRCRVQKQGTAGRTRGGRPATA